jgi:hypothetical protein
MSDGTLWKGLGIGVVLTAAGLLAGWFAVPARLVVIFAIGLAQLLWMLPACLYFRARGERETIKGLLIIAGLVFLLNASCWGIVLGNKFKIGG